MTREQIAADFGVAFKRAMDRFGGPDVINRMFPGGPVEYIGYMLEDIPPPRTPEQVAKKEWMINHREEAERIVAGILGLM